MSVDQTLFSEMAFYVFFQEMQNQGRLVERDGLLQLTSYCKPNLTIFLKAKQFRCNEKFKIMKRSSLSELFNTKRNIKKVVNCTVSSLSNSLPWLSHKTQIFYSIVIGHLYLEWMVTISICGVVSLPLPIRMLLSIYTRDPCLYPFLTCVQTYRWTDRQIDR